MSKLRYRASMSLDGFVAGRDQSVENPLGIGGHKLHEWMRALAVWRKEAGLEGGVVNASTAVLEEGDVNVGALLMGRNMFGGGPGPWGDDPWQGWWGDEPPFGRPVFVLTHHEREPLEMEGGTTFQFVTDGIESALEQARAAGEGDVQIGGGAEVIQQYLAAGLVDEMWLNVVPVLFGGGTPLFDETTAGAGLEQVRVIGAPGVVHLNYRRGD
jgi:dihydrofolate reductase